MDWSNVLRTLSNVKRNINHPKMKPSKLIKPETFSFGGLVNLCIKWNFKNSVSFLEDMCYLTATFIQLYSAYVEYGIPLKWTGYLENLSLVCFFLCPKYQCYLPLFYLNHQSL